MAVIQERHRNNQRCSALSQSWWDESEYPPTLTNELFATILNEKHVCEKNTGKNSNSKKIVNTNTGISEVSYTDEKFRITLSLAPFNCKTARVFVTEEKLTIYAEHEEIEDEDNLEHTISRKLSRKYALPKFCVIKNSEAYAFEDKLVINIPRVLSRESHELSVVLFGDEREPDEDKRKHLHKVIRKVQTESLSEGLYHLSDCSLDNRDAKDVDKRTVFDSIIEDSLHLSTSKKVGEEGSEKEVLANKEKPEVPAVQLEVLPNPTEMPDKGEDSNSASPESRRKSSSSSEVEDVDLGSMIMPCSKKLGVVVLGSIPIVTCDINSRFRMPDNGALFVAENPAKCSVTSLAHDDLAETATGTSPKSEETATGTSPKSEETATGTSPKSEETATGTSPKAKKAETATVVSVEKQKDSEVKQF